MSNHATAPVQLEQPGVDPVYLTRDDLAYSLNPINALERMLVTAMAQAWHQLQHARELESQIFAETRPFDLFSTRLGDFQAITRYVANSDRTWRQSIATFERARRNRPARPILRPRTAPGFQNEPNFHPATPVQQNEPNPAPSNRNEQNEANSHPATPVHQNEPNPAQSKPRSAKPTVSLLTTCHLPPATCHLPVHQDEPNPAPSKPRSAKPTVSLLATCHLPPATCHLPPDN